MIKSKYSKIVVLMLIGVLAFGSFSFAGVIGGDGETYDGFLYIYNSPNPNHIDMEINGHTVTNVEKVGINNNDDVPYSNMKFSDFKGTYQPTTDFDTYINYELIQGYNDLDNIFSGDIVILSGFRTPDNPYYSGKQHSIGDALDLIFDNSPYDTAQELSMSTSGSWDRYINYFEGGYYGPNNVYGSDFDGVHVDMRYDR